MSQFKDSDASSARRVGGIRVRGGRLQVRLFAGRDAVTGKDVCLTAIIRGTGKAARKRAEDTLAGFRAQVLKQRTAPTSVTLAYAVDEWLRTSEVEDSTRRLRQLHPSHARPASRSEARRAHLGEFLHRATPLPRAMRPEAIHPAPLDR